MSTNSFAFLIHPLDPVRDVARKYPALASLPAWLIEFLSLFYPPVLISEIRGVRSAQDGQTAQGWFIACPLSARLMVTLPPDFVYRKIVQSGWLAERLGARILGLGAFTSVVGDGGITISHALNIPATTGNSFTVATSLQAVHLAAQRLNIDLNRATAAIVGASGAIGSVCARLLAPDVQHLILIGRQTRNLQGVAAAAFQAGARSVETSADMGRLCQAEVVISVSSALKPLIQPHHLQSGALVCDIARPRDVAQDVSKKRADVLVFEGGIVRVPGAVDFGFDFGFPPGTAYACMAETMALALEGRYEPFSLGKRLQLGAVKEIESIAARHGFAVAGLRNFERALTDDEVTAVLGRRPSQHRFGGATVPAIV